MSSRHPTLLSRDNAIVIVIDVQPPFLRAIEGADSLARSINILLSGSARLGVPIIATLQNENKLGGLAEEIGIPTGCKAIKKTSFSCAGNEAIVSAIETSGRAQVMLCGVEAHICVVQTALDLVHRGYQVHVVADAVSSRQDQHRELALRRMERAGVILTTVESALYEMLGSSDAVEFRSILQLVK
jgi:nicotinamidase-related amidase